MMKNLPCTPFICGLEGPTYGDLKNIKKNDKKKEKKSDNKTVVVYNNKSSSCLRIHTPVHTRAYTESGAQPLLASLIIIPA